MTRTALGLLAGAVLLVGTEALADIYKTMHITNPSNQAAKDMHVTFKRNLKGDRPTRGVKDGRKSYASDAFDSCNPQQAVANFGDGTLAAGATDNFQVNLRGNTSSKNKQIVEKVEFTDGQGEVFYTMEPAGSKEKRKEFAKNVTGFTNAEYFDFSDIENASLHLFNPDAELNLRYTITDFAVYKDLPLSSFNLDDFEDITGGTLVFTSDAVVIRPGESFEVGLGAVDPTSYAMAMCSSIEVEDLDTGETLTYGVPQHYASDVPSPPGSVLLLAGALGIGLPRRRSNR